MIVTEGESITYGCMNCGTLLVGFGRIDNCLECGGDLFGCELEGDPRSSEEKEMQGTPFKGPRLIQ